MLADIVPAVVLAVQLYLLLTAVDVVLAWLQEDPRRWPRRLTHLLTEPVQAPLRRLLPPRLTGGWDLSPVVVVAILGALRVWLRLP